MKMNLLYLSKIVICFVPSFIGERQLRGLDSTTLRLSSLLAQGRYQQKAEEFDEDCLSLASAFLLAL